MKSFLPQREVVIGRTKRKGKWKMEKQVWDNKSCEGYYETLTRFTSGVYMLAGYVNERIFFFQGNITKEQAKAWLKSNNKNIPQEISG